MIAANPRLQAPPGGSKRRSDSYNFSSLANTEASVGNEQDIKHLLDTCPAERREEFSKNLNSFQKLFKRFLEEEGKEIEWEKIFPPPEEMIKPYSTLSEPTSGIKEMLNRLVVVKLNGGLGTTMGCTGPKSVITVRNEFTFLDMQVQQIAYLNTTYGCNIPLVLMNSFNTHEDTQKVLRKYIHVNVPLHCFQQSQYPRIFKESLRSVAKSVVDTEGDESWYPPGHGDLYQAFYNSGLLGKFIEEGKEYLFISNIDNLGATVDLSILHHLHSQKHDKKSEFVMEVTDKTKADVKGGTLIKYNDKLRLLEIAQVPKGHVEDFKSVSKFRIFNTNNLWVQLPALESLLESNSLHMEIITNNKRLDNGDKIIQLEVAVGAAIKCFNNAIGINVPRKRFLPVKTCSDLFLVKSNLYTMNKGTLSMSSNRQFPSTPLVQLGNYYQKVKEFINRLDGIPDIIDLDHLTVAGDVTFGKGVVLRGTVIIIANHGECINIPSGSILENKIVSGNLRIMDH